MRAPGGPCQRARRTRQRDRAHCALRGERAGTGGSAPEKACKPGPVPRAVRPGATIICLRRRLPGASSGQPESRAGHPIALLFGLAPGGVCLADAVTRAAGELLPHRFTLTVLLRRSVLCGTVPWGRPPWPLASTLPCGARTFLPPRCRDRRSPGFLWRT